MQESQIRQGATGVTSITSITDHDVKAKAESRHQPWDSTLPMPSTYSFQRLVHQLLNILVIIGDTCLALVAASETGS